MFRNDREKSVRRVYTALATWVGDWDLLMSTRQRYWSISDDRHALITASSCYDEHRQTDRHGQWDRDRQRRTHRPVGSDSRVLRAEHLTYLTQVGSSWIWTTPLWTTSAELTMFDLCRSDLSVLQFRRALKTFSFDGDFVTSALSKTVSRIIWVKVVLVL